jgi:hypothetical protein
MMTRRIHYSTALAQGQGILPECFTLFDAWEPGMSVKTLFEAARTQNLLSTSSDRRLRNLVVEAFGSRFLNAPHDEAAPSLKRVFHSRASARLKMEVVFLYVVRQHGIFYDFLTQCYWPAVRAARPQLNPAEVAPMIDLGLVEGKLKRDWSAATRKRVATYLFGTALDFELLRQPKRGVKKVSAWSPQEGTLLYLAYDLHFLGLSDDEVIAADEWAAFGLERSDVIQYLQRLEAKGHLHIQDTGRLCRIEWHYPTRDTLIDALLRRKN